MERDQVEHYFARSVGTRLHYAELGSGPPVVLLHGIPESWEAWRRTMVLLADGGHRSIAADLRGYGLSDKPRNVAAYRAELLAVDVASIIRACGEQCATVVGHSWGGLTAWLFAMRLPEMLERLVILDAPHPLVWIGAMRSIGFGVAIPRCSCSRCLGSRRPCCALGTSLHSGGTSSESWRGATCRWRPT